LLLNPQSDHTQVVHANDENSVLDICQLREITLEDEELMRELLACLVDDTASQLVLLDQAIRDRDPQRTKRIAHYSKGACANVGANALAAQLNRLELHAAAGRFDECAASVQILAREIDRLRTEAAEV
jgi:HPt (histidine-containing phosphotransfer) domain-containing protein